MAFPKNIKEPRPAVAVPFYFAEAMLGFDPATGEEFPRYSLYPMMADLARRGYVTASADAYHLTYTPQERARGDFGRWRVAAEALNREHPRWTGIGKLISDTRLMVDALAEDPRVDENRIGIAGHSLGGKMAFYTGCLDPRIRAILASDFGIRWEQTNWQDPWYWGEKVEQLKEAEMDHAQLLGLAAPKPFCLIAGQYDNMDSWAMMTQAPGYDPGEGRLKIIHHATGHMPPREALEEGYAFLDRWLRN
jgi:pimeloyl-ACP methyl ester carboxylesterase